MLKSESVKELAAALSKFQLEITNPKATSKNTQFNNSKYAPLNEILELIRPILGKQGLSIIQDVGGCLENTKITTLLMHSSGEWIESEPFLLKGEQVLKGGGKVLNIQGSGSMITYAKRYQVTSILGIDGSSDDDGNQACKREKQSATEETSEEEEFDIDPTKTKITKDMAASIRSMLKTAKVAERSFLEFYKCDKIENFTLENYTHGMKSLEKEIKKLKGSEQTSETEQKPQEDELNY